MKKTNFFIFSIMMFAYASIYPQNADQVVSEMGFGFNLGNSWDRGQNSRDSATLEKYIDAYIAIGARHVRIPVTWMTNLAHDNSLMVLKDGNWITSLNSPNNNYLEELKETIDYCISKGLYVVINTHHEEWLKDHYDGSNYYNIRFARLWTFIANEFQAYNKKLIFEVLNEPESVFGQDDGSGGWPTPGTLNTNQYTRQINQVGYDAIRATGGNNASRIIMISPNGQAADQYIKSVYPSASYLPGGGGDNNLALQVHSYDPWGFCGETGSSSYYTSNYSNDLSAKIKAEIETARDDANDLGVPLHYGEFGVGRVTSNQNDRDDARVRSWHRMFIETCLNNGIAVTLWEDRGWYQYISNDATSWIYNIVPYMLENINAGPANLTSAYFQLVNQGTGDYLKSISNSTIASGMIIQESQINPPPISWDSFQWYFQESSWSKNYMIFNKSYGLNFYPDGYVVTTNIAMRQSSFAHDDYVAESWQIEQSNLAGYYWIKNRKSNLYLQPQYSSQTSGTQIVQNTLSAADATFRWQFIKISNFSKNSNIKEVLNVQKLEGSNSSFKLFPNPVQELLNISIPNAKSKSLEVYSISGVQLFEKDVIGYDKVQINVSRFSKGIYLIKLIGLDTLYGKFVVE